MVNKKLIRLFVYSFDNCLSTFLIYKSHEVRKCDRKMESFFLKGCSCTFFLNAKCAKFPQGSQRNLCCRMYLLKNILAHFASSWRTLRLNNFFRKC